MSDNSNLVIPFINLNGMTAEEHVRLRLEAREKIRDAMVALGQLRPHGRDYNGKNTEFYDHQAIHNNRVLYLNTLYDELEEEAAAIQEQREG